uniref:Uncharacterized protein n=1 Tax=Pristhesancus plagipennis TaxID=1955184 RepID=A0A2K8JMG6_PRIPG|nr:secreted hypothetical protein [Pristhesancus plagipennis]
MLAVILTAILIIQTVAGMTWMDGAPLPLYHPRSGKRQHLPYHPVARFRGADSRPYFSYDYNTYNDFTPTFTRADVEEKQQMNAGELLALLFARLKENELSRMKGTLRFGILKR